jgi:hypothetical protein
MDIYKEEQETDNYGELFFWENKFAP